MPLSPLTFPSQLLPWVVGQPPRPPPSDWLLGEHLCSPPEAFRHRERRGRGLGISQLSRVHGSKGVDLFSVAPESRTWTHR